MSTTNNVKGLNASVLGDLWFFVVAARRKSFGSAAQELHVTQGAVSQRIRQLEERLATKLFIRAGRGVILTGPGEELFDAIDMSFHDIARRVSHLAREREHTDLVVSCTPSLSMEWLLPRLSEWNRISRHVRIQIRAEFHRVTRDVMMNEGIDIAIRYDRESYHDLHAVNLLEERIFPVCTAAYWCENDKFRTPSALSRLTLLHDAAPWEGAPPDMEWRSWAETWHAHDLDVGSGMFFNLAQMAMRAALLHQGVAMGRQILATDHLAQGRLIRPFGDATSPGACYRFITLTPPREDSQESRFAAWMKEQLLLSLG